jgi:hypothetical protein
MAKNSEKLAKAYEADDRFSKALKSHNLDRWSDSAKWPQDVCQAFEEKKAADKEAFEN